MGHIKTHIDSLNSALGGGLPEGELTVVSGLSGSGKTDFIQQCAISSANQGVKTLLVMRGYQTAAIIARLDQVDNLAARTHLWFSNWSQIFRAFDSVFVDDIDEAAKIGYIPSIQHVVDYFRCNGATLVVTSEAPAVSYAESVVLRLGYDTGRYTVRVTKDLSQKCGFTPKVLDCTRLPGQEAVSSGVAREDDHAGMVYYPFTGRWGWL